MRNIALLSLLLLLPLPAVADTALAAILPLTGNAADQGEWARRGFEIGSQQLQESGEHYSLVYEDSKGGDPATAVKAYKSMLARAHYPIVFTYGSGVGMALSPLVNADRIIQMGIATATPKYRSEGDYTFRNFPSATLEAEFLAETLSKKLMVTELAILNISNDYGVGTSGAAEGEFTKRGGTVVFHEAFNPGESDFKPILLRLRSRPTLTVYLAAYPTDGALILKQAKELGLKNRFIASVAIIGGSDFFDLVGDAAEGLLVISTSGKSGSEFENRYNSKFTGESPAQRIYAARAYDALMLFANVVRVCKSIDTDCIRRELSKVREYGGASGTLTFDSAGDVTTNFSLFEIRARSFVALSP